MSEEKPVSLVNDAVGMLLYRLLQHHVLAGTLEDLVDVAVKESEVGVPDTKLAEYAAELSSRLAGAKVNNMTEKLSQIFGSEPAEEQQDEEIEGPIFSRNSEEEIAGELELMRDEIEEAASKLDPEEDYEKLVEAAKYSDKQSEKDKKIQQEMQKLTTIEDAEGVLVELQNKGLLTEEQAKAVQSDIEEFKEKQDGRAPDQKE